MQQLLHDDCGPIFAYPPIARIEMDSPTDHERRWWKLRLVWDGSAVKGYRDVRCADSHQIDKNRFVSSRSNRLTPNTARQNKRGLA